MNTTQGICAQPALRNLKLNHEWVIREPISKQNERHATIYPVLVSETGQPSEDLEAHVFALDGIDTKLRKHRQRCIKRMEGRTKLKLEVGTITIVVITTLQTVNIGASEQGVERRSLSNDGKQDIDVGTSSIGKRKEKSRYQLESQRMRQKERRQAGRAARKRQRNERTIDGGHIAQRIDRDNLTDGNNQFSMFTVLIHELLDGWGWEEISAMYTSLHKNEDSGYLHEVYHQYLLQTAAALKKLKELEFHLKVRRNIIIARQTYYASMAVYQRTSVLE